MIRLFKHYVPHTVPASLIDKLRSMGTNAEPNEGAR